MGGQREQTVPQKKAAPVGNPVTVGAVRFHQSGDEVHFHDDGNIRKKVVIPVAEWFKAWQDLEKKVPSKFQYVDGLQKTCLHVETVIVKGDVDVLMHIDCITSSATFKKMQDFCK